MAATPSTDYSSSFTRVESPNPQSAGRWAERLATVPDLDGDGKNEILMADLNESFGGFSRAGRVYMQDGATRKLLYLVDSPQIQALALFGFFITVIGDVNGDGKADFVAGTDAQDTLADGSPCTPPASPAPLGPCNQDQGKAWVFSGSTGQTLYALNNPNPQGFARFGSRIGRAGDVNGDGVQDVIVGASNNDAPAGCGNDPATGRALAQTALPANCRANEGEAFIFSGKASDHALGAPGLLRTLNLTAPNRAPAPCGGTVVAPVVSSPCGNLGLAVQGPGDINGDGVVDQLVDASAFNYETAAPKGPCTTFASPTCNRGQGAEFLFSGKDGSLIRRTDDPEPAARVNFGFQDVEPLAPGDVNGDNVPDYYANGFGQDGPKGEKEGGRAWVFSGKDGSLLYEVLDPTPAEGGQFGWSMTKTDYNKDGNPDLYVGQSPHSTSSTALNQSGGTYVYKGSDGSLLKALELTPTDAQPGVGASSNNGSNLGWAMAAPGDLNGDGEPDYVAGAPFTDVGPSAFNCQAPTAGCVQDVGREFFFYSKLAVVTPTPTYTIPTPTPTYTVPTPTPTSTGTTRKRPGLSAAVRPKRDRRRPYRFTTRGTLRRPSGVSKAAGCKGKVRVTVKRKGRKKTLSSKLATVKGSCRFSSKVSFKNRKRFGKGRRGTLRFTIRFQGNARLLPKSITRTARYG